ncbi:MAG: FAD:protein FMN transferase [Pseudomonadota bacterium]
MLTRREALSLIGAAALTGCQRAPETVTREWLIFTTLLRVTLSARDRDTAAELCNGVHRQLLVTGSDLYGFGAGELGSANTLLADGDSPQLSPRLARILRDADQWRRRSAYRFDPAVGGLIALWGLDDLIDAEVPRLPDAQQLEQALDARASGYSVSERGVLSAGNPPPIIDLGAIAKGVLLGEVMDMLQDSPCQRVLIDLGGDIGVHANSPDETFRIAVANPSGARPEIALELLAGEYVMTSGDYARYVEIDGQRYQHILDPTSGWPVPPAAATVICDDPVQADASATALVVAGAAGFDAVCDAMGVNKALLIDNAGVMHATPEIRKRTL